MFHFLPSFARLSITVLRGTIYLIHLKNLSLQLIELRAELRSVGNSVSNAFILKRGTEARTMRSDADEVNAVK